MEKLICFDMDGTIADLYSQKEWLQNLNQEKTTPYDNARPMINIKELNTICSKLRSHGWQVGVITWLAKNSTPEYKKAVRQSKKDWLQKVGFNYDFFHGVQYGYTKADTIRNADIAILFDDNVKVRRGFKGLSFDEKNILKTLKQLLRYEEERGF